LYGLDAHKQSSMPGGDPRCPALARASAAGARIEAATGARCRRDAGAERVIVVLHEDRKVVRVRLDNLVLLVPDAGAEAEEPAGSKGRAPPPLDAVAVAVAEEGAAGADDKGSANSEEAYWSQEMLSPMSPVPPARPDNMVLQDIDIPETRV
jgi:hypothetical protein